MSSNLNDAAEVPFTCPKCGHKFTKTVGELKADAHFACPVCQAGFDASNFNADIQKADNMLDDIRRKLGRLGK